MQNNVFLLFYTFLLGGMALLLYPFVRVLHFFPFFPDHVLKRFWPERKRLHPPRFPRIWVHALSLGEMYSVFPLLDLFLKYPVEIVCTVSTETGMAAVQKAYAGKVLDIRFFPLDHPAAVLRTVEDIAPDFFILVETDLWPFFMYTLRQKGVPAFWVNARFSAKTFKGYSRVPFLMEPAMNTFKAIFPQRALDRDRMERFGVSPGKILPPGNLKQDRKTPDPNRKEIMDIRNFLGNQGDPFILVCGSFHPGEEKILSQMLRHDALSGKKMVCILVPRHPEDAPSFLENLRTGGISASIFQGEGEWHGEKVVLIDRMGLLADLYSLGDAAIVGGSLIPPFKGHNPFEPAMAGIPVMMGPHYENFAESFDGLLAAGAALLAKIPEEGAKNLAFWIDSPEKRMESGRAGRRFADAGKGTAEKVVQSVMKYLETDHAAKSR